MKSAATINLQEWRGLGFTFADGRACIGFRVRATSELEAKALLNSAAGWKWFGEEPLRSAAVTMRAGSKPAVLVRWEARGALVEVDSRRRRGRMPDVSVAPATQRVQKSVRLLKASGGHRTTIRLNTRAWQNLQLLMKHFGLGQAETLDVVMQEKAAQLKDPSGQVRR